MNLGKRIDTRLAELNWQRNDLLALVPELSAQSLSALITRDSRRSEHDVAIATALGVNLLWLISGQGDKLVGNGQGSEEIINIPLSPIVNDPHPTCILPVRNGLSIHKSWVNTIFPDMARDADLCVVPVNGYGMSPTFSAGDLLLVDQGVRSLTEDGIYITRMGDAVQAKRLQQQPDGSIVMLSDSSQYAPFILKSESRDSLTILGRVIYAWTGVQL
jgi:hypothetical protein